MVEIVGDLVTGIVKSVEISDKKRRSVNSSARLTLEDDSVWEFAEFNLNPEALSRITVQFKNTSPISSLKILQPYTYLLRVAGASVISLNAIAKNLSKNGIDYTPINIEEYVKASMLELYKYCKQDNHPIPRLSKKLKERLKNFLDDYHIPEFFIPFSLKYEMFFHILNNLEKGGNAQKYFAKYYDFFKKTKLEIDSYDSLNGRINHRVFTDIINEVARIDKLSYVYIVALFIYSENRVYEKTFSKDESEYAFLQTFDDMDSSNMYMPFWKLPDGMKSDDMGIDETWDLNRFAEFFKSINIHTMNRYHSLNYKINLLDKNIAHKLPYNKGAIMYELAISGLDFEQVDFFLNNLDEFERDTPYHFYKKKDEDENQVNFTHKELELLIKKSGFNKGYVLLDNINNMIKEHLDAFSRENIYLNTVKIHKSKEPIIYTDIDNTIVVDKQYYGDVKEFYKYTYDFNKDYLNFVEKLHNNIDMAGFLYACGIKDYKDELSLESFRNLFESYILKHGDRFIALDYEVFADDALYALKAIPSVAKRPNEQLPAFSKLGLSLIDRVEETIFSQIITASKTPDSLKDDGKFEAYLANEERANGFKFTKEQVAALRRCYTLPKIFILSGYAGTGKSTITRSIVKRFSQCGYKKINGCALAGVAANRLHSLINQHCTTIHSLLKYTGGDMFLAPPELDLDLLVIDEASMIDSMLFKELISRVNFARTSVIIIGDDAQLPPIGKGSPFSDIISAISDNLVELPSAILTEVQRSAGTIVEVANAIRSGNYEEILDDLYSEENTQKQLVRKEIAYINKDAPPFIQKRFDPRYTLSKGTVEYEIYKNLSYGEKLGEEVSAIGLLKKQCIDIFTNFTKNERGEFDINKVLSIQFISPTKIGNDFATRTLNKSIQAIKNADVDKNDVLTCMQVSKEKLFYLYDKVIHVRNANMENKVFIRDEGGFLTPSKENKVYNGQIGYIIELDDDLCKVFYPANSQIVLYNKTTMSALVELAYVLTAHKVQGNEFDTVINIIPFKKSSMDRRYLYSSFTRAKNKLYILGKREYLDKALIDDVKKRNTKTYKLFVERHNELMSN